MTIGVNNRMDYVGAGSTDTYSYNFKIFAATDLLVTQRDTDGVETTLAYPADFSVSGVGVAAGGSIVLTDGNLASGYALTIRRVRTIAQTTDIRNQSQVFNDVLEDTYDALVMIDQQQQDEIDRSLKYPETDGVAASTTLPAAADRALKTLSFDADGNPRAVATATDAAAEVALALQYRNEAEEFADAAGDHETNAETAETNAETAETNAEFAASLAQLLLATVRFATKALMDADLAHAAGTFAAVYADGTSTNNGIYYKLLGSGSGSWARYTGGSWTLDLLTVLTSMTIGGLTLQPPTKHPFRDAYVDPTGNVMLAFRNDGWVDIKVHRTSLPDHVDRFGGGRFSAQMNMIINAGQSLAVGPAGAITTVREYDNYKWTALTSTFEAATQNTGEPPSMGTMGHLKELLLEEDGISHTMNDYRLVTVDTGVSANTIVQLSPGGSSGAYEAGIAAVTAAKAKADAMGLTFAVQAVTWTQGEADAGAVEATHKAALVSIAEAYNTAIKAITGQTHDVVFIVYQTCSTVNKSVAVAQWKAAMDHPLIYMAGPIYQASYGDFQHLDAASSKYFLGGLYGLAIKRIKKDRVGWEPLQPKVVQVFGNNIDITFNKEALELDTTLMPAQTNSGFSVENGSAVAQTISSVSLISGNRVRLAMASTPAAGWRVKYGHNAVTGKSPFIGGGGNLRDNQGDAIVYNTTPLHNWCVIFDWEL